MEVDKELSDRVEAILRFGNIPALEELIEEEGKESLLQFLKHWKKGVILEYTPKPAGTIYKNEDFTLSSESLALKLLEYLDVPIGDEIWERFENMVNRFRRDARAYFNNYEVGMTLEDGLEANIRLKTQKDTSPAEPTAERG